ncbi:MAG: TVP38/TMEM64 family protein [Bacteroidales bacterium]
MRMTLFKNLQQMLKAEPSWFGLIAFFGAMPALVSSTLLLLFHDKISLIAASALYTLIFYTAAAFTMFLGLTPTTFIAVISGYAFGWKGLLLMMIAYPAAALMGLLFGKIINRWITGSEGFIHPGLKRFFDVLGEQQFLLFFFCRLSPVLPFAMTNVALSRMKVSLLPYITGTMVGMFPRTMLFFLAGTQTRDLVAFLQNPSYSRADQLLLPLFVIISIFGLALLFNRAIKKLSQKYIA